MVTADSIFHFRIAATMLSPWEYKSGAYSQENLDDFAYRSRHVWWNRDAVDWIDSDSFPSLSSVKLEKLRVLIAKFLMNIESNRVASLNETLVARNALLEIFEIVGERIYDQSVTDAAIILTKEIRDPKYGSFFKDFDIQFDESWTGDPIIVVWLVVEDPPRDDLERVAGSLCAVEAPDGIGAGRILDGGCGLNPHHLIELAELVARGSGGRPRQTDLRRAVSTLYYALFHLLAQHGAKLVSTRAALRFQIARKFDHGKMKAVSNEFKKGDVPAYFKTQLDSIPKELARLAELFVRLQEARHQADYDTHSDADVSKAEVMKLLEETKTILIAWPTIEGHIATEHYLLAMLLRPLERS